jgi:hypothetical protein
MRSQAKRRGVPVLNAKGVLLGVLCVALLVLGAGPPPAQGAPSDPLFVFTPFPPPAGSITPPPTGTLNGPCGLAVDSAGRYYVSDYYHHAVDVFSGKSYVAQLANEDPLDGPCGLALDASNNLYVNNYHRNVVKFGTSPSFGVGTVFPLPTEDQSHHLPTGVAVDLSGRVYVDERTYVAVFDTAGNPVLDEGEPLRIGLGSLGDGYGVAVSQFPATFGRIYVPDAATNTVKVYDPVIDTENPVATIKDPFGKPFASLRDSAIAVDRVSGDVYVAEDIQPEYTEKPQATIHVYSSVNSYKGHLKYNVIDARPPGLAVDNSGTATQGRVYVTSGNTDKASIYAYPPGAATSATPLPPAASVVPTSGSPGVGTVTSEPSSTSCSSGCREPAALSGSQQAGASSNPLGSAPRRAGALRRHSHRAKHRGAKHRHVKRKSER